jgi:ribosomal protein L37E
MTDKIGEIRIRSNVSIRPHAWDLVPGDLLKHWRPAELAPSGDATSLQRAESMYHQNCFCGRRLFDIETFGCDECRFTPALDLLERRQRQWERTIERIRELELEEQRRIEFERTGRNGA